MFRVGDKVIRKTTEELDALGLCGSHRSTIQRGVVTDVTRNSMWIKITEDTGGQLEVGYAYHGLKRYWKREGLRYENR